jgi:flavorubredoxin
VIIVINYLTKKVYIIVCKIYKRNFIPLLKGGKMMSEILMVFASMTGNTEEMANAIAEGIQEAGKALEINDIIEIPSASKLEKFDGILLGSYTWGEGDLPDEFLDIFEEMGEINLSGKKLSYLVLVILFTISMLVRLIF